MMPSSHSQALSLSGTAILAVTALFALPVAANEPTAEALKFFENKIRPVLAEKCFDCHGADKQKGDLRVDNLAYLLHGGSGGPALKPGDVAGSMLIRAVSYEDTELQMPPKEQLSAAQVEDLKTWVAMGAPWPQQEVSQVKIAKPGEFSEEDKAWWAFQPVTPTPPPATAETSAVIDRFVHAKLEQEGLRPAPEADRYELVRRVYFDLHGLPPTPEQVQAFVQDRRPDAYERLIDALLESPRYGERWAQHWLDVVRYSESDGYRQDAYRPNAWPYRDYVVKSLNEDKPYDQFVREQLAGDELDPENPEVLVATGYLRHGIYEYNQRDAEGQRELIVNEVTDATGEIFLGLSFGCARCHDHKFDPILQKDYYRLQAFFTPIQWRDDIPLATKEEQEVYAEKLKVWMEATKEVRPAVDALIEPKKKSMAEYSIKLFPEEVQAMVNKPESERTPYESVISYLVERQHKDSYASLVPARQKGEFKEKLTAAMEGLKPFESLKPEPLRMAFVATDCGPVAPPTLLKSRKGKTEIQPGFLTLLEPGDLDLKPAPGAKTTGRRTALANWITRPDNPLTSRVMVNRLWQYHFGRGIAASTSDFGRLGEKPTHPELLDWLAHEFVDGGWSIKRMHRLIMTSATYRQTATQSPSDVALTKDPENRLLWKMNAQRLDAGQVRDALLLASGELRDTFGGVGEDASQPLRTLYTRKIRNSQNDLLRSFDAPPGFQSVAKRDSTNTALQSLMMINGEWPITRARSMATRIMKDRSVGLPGWINRAFELTFSRPATAKELNLATQFVKQQEKLLEKEKPVAPIISNPLVDAKPYFGETRLGGLKAVSFKPGSPFEKMKVHTNTPESDEFTVEAVVYLDSVYPDASVRTIASRWNQDKVAKGWSLGVTSTASRYKPNNLIMQLVGDDFQGSVVYEVVPSALRIPVKTPYYVGAVLSRQPGVGQKFGGTITFYAKDLSDANAPMQTVTVSHQVVGGYVNQERNLMIGGADRSSGHFWNGVISRVIVTNGMLPTDQLLTGTVGAAGRCVFDAQAGTLASTSEPTFTWDKPTVAPVQANRSHLTDAFADFCHALINTNEFLYLQ